MIKMWIKLGMNESFVCSPFTSTIRMMKMKKKNKAAIVFVGSDLAKQAF